MPLRTPPPSPDRASFRGSPRRIWRRCRSPGSRAGGWRSPWVLLFAAWIILMFARQVSEAAAATTRADVLVTSNDDQAARVAALSRELQQIQRQRYIDQQARAYGLGRTREIAFSLDPNAPPLPADAPGSASVRLGTASDDGTPLDHWLTLLFGSDD